MTLTKSRRLAREITDEILGPMRAELIVVPASGDGRKVTREEAMAAIVKVLLTPKPQPERTNTKL